MVRRIRRAKIKRWLMMAKDLVNDKNSLTKLQILIGMIVMIGENWESPAVCVALVPGDSQRANDKPILVPGTPGTPGKLKHARCMSRRKLGLGLESGWWSHVRAGTLEVLYEVRIGNHCRGTSEIFPQCFCAMLAP